MKHCEICYSSDDVRTRDLCKTHDPAKPPEQPARVETASVPARDAI